MSAYRRILVAIDGSDAAARGLREAVRLAREQKSQLCIVHVVNEAVPYTPLAGAPPVNLVPQLIESGRRVLERARAQARKHGVRAKTVLVESTGGEVAPRILAQVRRQRADLVVLGTHGRRGLRRLVLGSDAEHVVRASSVPVLLVRA